MSCQVCATKTGGFSIYREITRVPIPRGHTIVSTSWIRTAPNADASTPGTAISTSIGAFTDAGNRVVEQPSTGSPATDQYKQLSGLLDISADGTDNLVLMIGSDNTASVDTCFLTTTWSSTTARPDSGRLRGILLRREIA